MDFIYRYVIVVFICMVHLSVLSIRLKIIRSFLGVSQ